MTHNESTQKPARPVEVVARHMRELRESRHLTAAQLAERMREAGIPWKREVVANLETGRRASVGVDEVLALAAVLEVAPTNLLVPLDDQPYQVTPKRVEPSGRVRHWVRGAVPLPGTDPRRFYSWIPPDEWDLFVAARSDDPSERLRAELKMLDLWQRGAERSQQEIEQREEDERG